MIITRVYTTPIRIPLTQFFYNSEGAGTKKEWGGRLSRVSTKRPAPILEYVLVHIDTDEGISGLGEAPADIGFFGQTLESIRYAIDDYMGPQLVGKDPLDRAALMELIDYRENCCAKSGIDLALYDLAGKIAGKSLTDLLGGALRTRIPVAIEIAGGSPDDMANACVNYMKQNVRAFKPKIGSDPDKDADRLRAIRDAIGPDLSMRADANRGYSPEEAIRLCHLAEKHELGLELLEQPVDEWDIQGMAHVRRSVNTLIEADESCFSIHDAERIIREEAADVLNIKIAKAGGLANASKIAKLAADAGLKCVLGTAFGVGPKIAAKLHFAAATPGLVDAVEFTELGLHGPMIEGHYDQRLSLPLDEDGCLPVPEGHGLGVSMDDAQIRGLSQ